MGRDSSTIFGTSESSPVPSFGNYTTAKNFLKLERVQKRAANIISGLKDVTYEEKLEEI